MNKITIVIITVLLLYYSGRSSSYPLEQSNVIETQKGNGIETETISPDSMIDLSAFNSSIFGNPNQTVGDILSTWTPESLMNPEEMGSYVEGDILIPHGNIRNGLTAQSSRWPGGVIPFVIQGSFNAFEMDLIERGINEYHARTCIRLKPRTNERDYVAIVNDNSGCWSSVGRVGGRQEVNLQTPACVSRIGTFLHEMMHAVGFFHEQNRYDRDGHVIIKYENILSGTSSNFDKTSSDKAHAFGVPYDYGSVMHYSANAFSRNGNPTIIARTSQGSNRMGQRDAFSSTDVERINRMYNCRGGGYASSGEGGLGSGGSGFPDTERPQIFPRPTERPQRPEWPSRPERPNRPDRPSRPSIIGSLIGSFVNGLAGIFGEENENQTTTTTEINNI